MFKVPTVMQPCSQGLSSSHPLERGKDRPWEQGWYHVNVQSDHVNVQSTEGVFYMFFP